ncbi:sigma-70 family RNA polymerase sigma factor [Polaribacter sp.]|nr:sigma-70 family RNA polymerase sigma factor [Polaribacter sp.]
MEISPQKIQHNIDEAKLGNQNAFRFLLNTFWKDVYSYQLKRTRNENEAEDITIQAFSKAFDKIDTYKSKYVFKTWIITISKNIHIDQLRKKNNLVTTEHEDKAYLVADENPTPEDKLITEQNLAKLLKDIKELKPKYREMIYLRYFQELSYKEISAHLDEPMNNIKVKLLRAKKLLAEIINKN